MSIIFDYRKFPQWIKNGEFISQLNTNQEDEDEDEEAQEYDENYYLISISNPDAEIFARMHYSETGDYTNFTFPQITVENLHIFLEGIRYFCIENERMNQLIYNLIMNNNLESIFDDDQYFELEKIKECVTFEHKNSLSKSCFKKKRYCCVYLFNKLRVSKQWEKNLSSKIAECGDIDLLTVIVSEGCPIDENACLLAARNGHTECFIFAKNMGSKVDQTVAIAALESGNPLCLHEVLPRMYNIRIIDICMEAAYQGNINLFEYALNEEQNKLLIANFPIHDPMTKKDEICVTAISQDNDEFLKYIHQKYGIREFIGVNERNLSLGFVVNSIINGSDKCLTFLLSLGFDIPERTDVYGHAVNSKNIKILKILIGKNIPVNINRLVNLKKGDYEFVEFVETLNITPEIRKTIFDYTSEYGFLDLYKKNFEYIYTVDNDIVEFNNYKYHHMYTTNYFNNILELGNVNFMRYFMEHNNNQNKYRMIIFEEYNNFEMVDYLLSTEFVNFKDACESAILHKNYEMFYYLYERGCPVTSKCFEYAILVKNLDIFKFLDDNQCEMNKKNILSVCIQHKAKIFFDYCVEWGCKITKENIKHIKANDLSWLE